MIVVDYGWLWSVMLDYAWLISGWQWLLMVDLLLVTIGWLVFTIVSGWFTVSLVMVLYGWNQWLISAC